MKKITKLLAIILVAVLTVGVVPTQAEAATKKVTANVNPDKAGKLNTGNNLVTCKKNNAYFIFKAPKTGKYTFTFSNVVSLGDANTTGLGNIYVLQRKKTTTGSKYFVSRKVSTEGGKSSILKMASKNFNTKNLHQKGIDQYRKTRSAKKVSLKKGEIIWFQFYYTAQRGKFNVKVTKVKKKK